MFATPAHTFLLVFYALAQFFAHSYVEVKTRTPVYLARTCSRLHSRPFTFSCSSSLVNVYIHAAAQSLALCYPKMPDPASLPRLRASSYLHDLAQTRRLLHMFIRAPILELFLPSQNAHATTSMHLLSLIHTCAHSPTLAFESCRSTTHRLAACFLANTNTRISPIKHSSAAKRVV